MRRLFVILPVALFAALAITLGVLTLQSREGRDPSLIPSALIGKPVPQFALPAIAEAIPGGFTTADLAGRLTLVNVFASWCVPCLAEHPLVTRLAEEGYAVYGLNYRDEPAKAAQWLATHGNPYTAVGADTEGRIALDWGVTGVPETFIIDAQGRILFKQTGPMTPQVLEEDILPRLREAAG